MDFSKLFMHFFTLFWTLNTPIFAPMDANSKPTGPSGKDFRRFIEEINPDRKVLYEDLNVSRSAFFQLYRKDIVPWHKVAEVHRVLSRDYKYNLRHYFPDLPSDIDTMGKQEDHYENQLIRALRTQNEALEKKNLELTEKLNLAYERIVNGFYDRHIATLDEQLRILRELLGGKRV